MMKRKQLTSKDGGDVKATKTDDQEKRDARKPILPMMVILTTVKVSLNGEGYLGQKRGCDLDSDGDVQVVMCKHESETIPTKGNSKTVTK